MWKVSLQKFPSWKTVKIIWDSAYNHQDIPSPKIPWNALEELLLIFATRTPVMSSRIELYAHVDGVSMGPTFANFYASWIQNKIFTEHPTDKPKIYRSYMDDIFVVVDNFSQLETLWDLFERHSIFKFIYEFQTKKSISFLDTVVSNNINRVTTSVNDKRTDTGECLNYNSLCPDRYKIGVIKKTSYIVLMRYAAVGIYSWRGSTASNKCWWTTVSLTE